MRFRKLRIAWSVFWGLAAVLLIVLWVRSYWQFDILATPWFTVGSCFGMCGMELFSPRRWETIHQSIDEWEKVSPLAGGSPIWGRFVVEAQSLVLPYWFIFLLALCLAVAPWIRWSKRFGLRTLLVVMTLVAVVLGLMAYVAN